MDEGKVTHGDSRQKRTAGIDGEQKHAAIKHGVIHLTVGLPGAGKTTLAARIAAEQGALRLTPDDWMIPLFGESSPGNKRDVLEGRLLWTALQVAAVGGVAILDFGCWSRDERRAVRALAHEVGAAYVMHFVDLPEAERRARVLSRWKTAPHTTFDMTDAEQDHWLTLFERPDSDELANWGAAENSAAPDALDAQAPEGFDTWRQWAAWRWPGFE